ncbi:MAG: hypothetical protein ABIR16_01835 [Dokdonella sp.]
MKTLIIAGFNTVLALAAATRVEADSLLIENTMRGNMLAAPSRGLSMAQVERRYGAPLQKLPTVGGSSAQQPPINRWRYADYTVVFERNRVIHSVATLR